MEVTNAHLNIAAPVHTAHTMPVIAAQPFSALSQHIELALPNWHEQHT